MKKYILIILCCLTSFPLWSYNVNMIVEHYSVDQGLPNNTVNCTLKDRDGFIWFGTWYGLCCFDGVKFKTFNKQEHDSDVPPRKIQRIVEDKNGYIWVKTIDRKLYVFNKVTECFHAVYDDMKNYSENIQVIKLQNTAEGDVLLLTKDNLKSATSLTKCYRLKRNVLLIRNPPIQSARPFQCAYHPLTP